VADPLLFVRGLVVGFSIAAPVGPIGVLCIRKTLADGRAVGLATGLGAATADAFYGAVAGFGLTAVSGALVRHQGALRWIGGAFLCYLGLRTLASRPAARAAAAAGAGLLGSFAATLALTLANPMTILSFAAVFAGLGLVGAGAAGPAAAGLLVAGVFLGSAAWWLLLSGAVSVFRARVGPPALAWVNRASGLVILGFGAAALAAGLG
jgi:threonine/homoserine/homoserine lactone efflux protein